MDFQTFMSRVRFFITHPSVRLFVLPFFLLFFGIMYGVRLGNQFNWFATVVLYIVMVNMQLVEQFLFLSYTRQGRVNWQSLAAFDALVVTLLFVLLLLSNIMFFMLSLFYVVSIHLIYVFALKGTIYNLLVQTFLKGIIVTILASFIQINVIPISLIVQSIPLALMTLFHTSQSEKLDGIRYGITALPRPFLTQVSIVALVLAHVLPFFVGRIVFTNLFAVVVLIISMLWHFQFLRSQTYYANINRGKNYLATLYIAFSFIYTML